MVDVPDVREVGEGDEYYHVEFRDEDRFEKIRTPDWAANAASSVAEGSEVHTGKLKDSDEWKVQSVLIKKPVEKDTAVERAKRIIEKIES